MKIKTLSAANFLAAKIKEHREVISALEVKVSGHTKEGNPQFQSKQVVVQIKQVFRNGYREPYSYNHEARIELTADQVKFLYEQYLNQQIALLHKYETLLSNLKDE